MARPHDRGCLERDLAESASVAGGVDAPIAAGMGSVLRVMAPGGDGFATAPRPGPAARATASRSCPGRLSHSYFRHRPRYPRCVDADRKRAARRLGVAGERRAAWFYRFRGYRILARNVRAHGGEVDLVAVRGTTIVFCEVKTRGSNAMAPGFEAVDRGKRERLVRMADGFVHKLGRPELHIRYDILSLVWTGRRFQVTHFPDAFRPVADAVRPWKWRV